MMADKINDGGPAFPVKRYCDWDRHGMSLRDVAALAALQGMLANPTSRPREGAEDAASAFVEAAFVVADAFIAARETKP
jgi:hypothetical protein